jgi:hypothetical protein
MRTQIEEILQLQPQWTSANTAPMARRGVLVRSEATLWLHGHLEQLSATLPSTARDVLIEGRDGTGLKTEVPWVRVASESRSPSATIGFYVVYLFSGSGQYAYLSLNQGTTRWENGEFRPRPKQELIDRVTWARAKLSVALRDQGRCIQEIDLQASRPLGRGYELGNISALRYERGSVPSDDVLLDDLQLMVKTLGELYLHADAEFQIPGDPAPEVSDLVSTVERMVRPRRSTPSARLPIRLNSEERTAIERRAVEMVADHFRSSQYSVRDVGATESYDLDVKKDGEHLYILVKGTGSVGDELIVSHAEVQLAEALRPHLMLAVVGGIKLDRESRSARAYGGELVSCSPWRVQLSNLRPIAYRYRFPEA